MGCFRNKVVFTWVIRHIWKLGVRSGELAKKALRGQPWTYQPQGGLGGQRAVKGA